MDDLLISNKSEESIKQYLASSTQSVALTGKIWLDKNKVAKYIAAKLLGITLEKLASYPHFHEVSSVDNKKIGIDEIRKITSYLSLVVPSDKEVSRVILINDANLLTLESQNALLKNLEEPSAGTIFILTASTAGSLLPTITSRISLINLEPKTKEELRKWFISKGHDIKSVETALSMSGGQPGLMELILSSEDNSLSRATSLAKDMLKGNKLDRLSLVNDLSKNKEELGYFFYILKEMAKIGVKSANQSSAKRWNIILRAALKAETMLKANTQVKLTLTDFVLNIS